MTGQPNVTSYPRWPKSLLVNLHKNRSYRRRFLVKYPESQHVAKWVFILKFLCSTTGCFEPFLHSAATASVWKVQIRAHWSRGGGGTLSFVSFSRDAAKNNYSHYLLPVSSCCSFSAYAPPPTNNPSISDILITPSTAHQTSIRIDGQKYRQLPCFVNVERYMYRKANFMWPLFDMRIRSGQHRTEGDAMYTYCQLSCFVTVEICRYNNAISCDHYSTCALDQDNIEQRVTKCILVRLTRCVWT
jgi:hypothetical protein